MKRKERKNLRRRLEKLNSQKEFLASQYRYWCGRSPDRANALSQEVDAIDNQIAQLKRQLESC